MMTQEERREYLINYLLKEEIRIGRCKIPADKQGQEELLRSLMNVRPPKPIREEFLKIQDEYLKERNRERGITDIADLEPVETDPRLYIWQGDITTLKCDAIVNACNSQMLGCFSPMHACIDNFIHTYAGVELHLKCMRLCPCRGMRKKQERQRSHRVIIFRQSTFFIQLDRSYSGRLRERTKNCLQAVTGNV